MTDPERKRLVGPLYRLGTEIHEAEAADRFGARIRRQIVPLSASAAAVAAAIGVVIFLLLDSGGPASADSIVNRAPAAAAASRSVSFTSTITITLGSHQLERYAEQGAIDFQRRSYRSTLSLGKAGGAIEQRRVGGQLYVTQTRRGEQGAPTHWHAVRLAPEPAGRFASAPESVQFTDPPVVLDGLSSTRSPVSLIGQENLKGTPTKVYALDTNLGAFLRASTGGEPQPATYRAVAATITVWLDKRNRPRQVRQVFSARGAKITTVVAFTGYGVPVSVVAPPDSAVVARAPETAPSPLVASPSKLFEKLLFVRTKLKALH
jgi:hypothetical protein